MAKAAVKKNVGGRPRVDSTRLVLRLPTPFVKQMIDMGSQLSMETAQASARHFLTLGMQASLGALSNQRAVTQQAAMLGLVKDMFSGEIAVVEDPKPLKHKNQRKPSRDNTRSVARRAR